MITEKLNTKELFASFDATTSELLQLISAFSEEEINTVPFEGSWTAAQVAEHLLKSYAVVDTLNGPVKKTERQPGEKIDQIREVFLNFDIKLNSPEFILPSNAPVTKEKLLTSLKNCIVQIKKVVQTKDVSEICISFVLPVFGEFTRLEWIHFIICHTKRHIHQLKNIFEIVQNK